MTSNDGRRRATARPVARAFWILAGASLMISLSMGMRQSLGLFMGPVTRDLGIGTADFTFAIAVQNVVWGVTQPVAGGIADRWGCRPVMLAGAILYAAAIALTMTATGALAITLGAGLLIGGALSCTAASIPLSASARVVSESSRSMTLGIVSAVGSLGTFIAVPTQSVISGPGWRVALAGYIVLALAIIPAAFMGGAVDRLPPEPVDPGAGSTLRGVLNEAVHHHGYVVMATAFFVCGLQLVFLTTHLPTYLSLCGLDPMLGAQALVVLGACNVVGSYVFGWLGGRYPKQALLGLIYILRSACIGVYFVIPPTPLSTLLFAAGIGLLWMGVVPLVNGLVAQIFGMRYMATLTGIAFFSHQLGSFLGAWGGGLIFDALGSYDRAWQFAVIIGITAGAAQMFAGDRPLANMAAIASRT